MKHPNTLYMSLCLFCLALAIIGCGGDEEDGDTYACEFEERRTDGCDGYGWMDWEADCFTFNSDDYYITPEAVCANFTESGLNCESDCCVDFEYRNVSLTQGGCP